MKENFKPEKHWKVDKKASQASHNTATEISDLKGDNCTSHTLEPHILELTALAVYLKDLSSTQSSEERERGGGASKDEGKGEAIALQASLKVANGGKKGGKKNGKN